MSVAYEDPLSIPNATNASFPGGEARNETDVVRHFGSDAESRNRAFLSASES